MNKEIRCPWSETNDLMRQYHDNEWGNPLHDDRMHFEFIVLDAFQAGLSWATILNKRENFRYAFDNFDPEIICHYDDKKFNALLHNPGIIRNRQKIKATISNAQKFIEIQNEFGSFDKFIWQFTGNKTIFNNLHIGSAFITHSAESDAMSKELQKRGFKFVGSTICYAYMQAAGMVNDHVLECFRYCGK